MATLLVIDLVTPTVLIQSLSTACLQPFAQLSLSSTLLNQSYLKVTSTKRSFGKEYYCYATDMIRLSQLSLIYVAYAQGLVCSALGCSKCDSQMENLLFLIHVAPHKMFLHTNERTQKKESGARENTLVWFLFNYMPAVLAYSTMLKTNTTDGGWALKAH